MPGRHPFLTGVILMAMGMLIGCSSPVSVRTIDYTTAMRESSRSILTSDDLSTSTKNAMGFLDLRETYKRDPIGAIETVREVAAQEPRVPWRVASAELYYDTARRLRPPDPTLYLASAREADLEIRRAIRFGGGLFDARTTLAAQLYNAATARFVELTQEDWIRDSDSRTYSGRAGSFLVSAPPSFTNDRWTPAYFDEFIPTNGLRVKGLRNRHLYDAYGAPVIAIRELAYAEPARAGAFLPPEGEIYPATITLEFPMVDVVDIQIWNPDSTYTIERHGEELKLSSDVSAPIAELFARSDLSQISRESMFEVQKHKDLTGIYMHEAYDPEKTIVLFVHGLRSSPITWRNMLNDLRADPDIRERFQFWMFLYPTGLPVARSAHFLRSELEAIREHFDPESDDASFDDFVVVGHSMGGLLTKALVQNSGDRLWDSLHPASFDEVDMSDSVRQHLGDVFFYEANEDIGRVVFIATPHAGSDFASSWIGSLGDALVDLPDEFDEIDDWFREQRASLRERLGLQIERGVPSSIDDLRPDSPHLIAYQETPIRQDLPYHSIIGNKSGDSDGIVPVTSARLEGSVSELVIDAGHNAHEHPLAIREVRRILLLHAEETD